jgi:peptidoglycan/LPS O-acetylase OafA/YrhL
MPVYVVLHLLVFVVGPFIGYKWLRDVGVARYLEYFVTNLTFTALPLGLPLAQQNSWTLTYEWAFYVLVAAAWVAARRSGGNRWVTMLIGLAAVATCIVFPIGWGFLLGMLLARFPPTWRMGASSRSRNRACELDRVLLRLSIFTVRFPRCRSPSSFSGQCCRKAPIPRDSFPCRHFSSWA